MAPPRIAPVDRIVGPGNAYVAEAKRQVFGRVGIDAIAGPSEVVVLADAANDPRHVAVDLLAQAEHDEAAQAILITDDAGVRRCRRRGGGGGAGDPAARRHRRGELAARTARIILVRDWDEAVGAGQPAGARAPATHAARPRSRCSPASAMPARSSSARFCPEALGDYVAGPNHVLPTGRTARFASGLSVFDFLKRTTWVEADCRRRWPRSAPPQSRWPRRKGCMRMPAASRCGCRPSRRP